MFKTDSGRFISYYGRQSAKNTPPLNADAKIRSLDQLFEILLKVWQKDTAYPSCQLEYDHDNDPSFGQCAITAVLVHDLFGGTIQKIRTNGGTHYFNVLNGKTIDLTSDQFTLYGIPLDYCNSIEVPREYCGTNPDTLKRLSLLKKRVESAADEKSDKSKKPE